MVSLNCERVHCGKLFGEHTSALYNAAKRRKLHRGVSGEVNSPAFVLISADINSSHIHQNKWNQQVTCKPTQRRYCVKQFASVDL